jgi:hypothetical protein
MNGNPIPVSADIKLAEWPSAAVARLMAATDVYLESLKGVDPPSADQAEYRTVIAAFRSYLQSINYQWNPLHFDIQGECGV